MKIIAQTARLTLAEFTLEDGPFILRLVNEPSWLQYIGDRHVYTLADAEKYLSEGSMRSYRERGFGFWKVILNETGIIIGTAGLARRDYLDDIDLGFAFLPEYTGQGYALESAKAVMEFADSGLGLDKLVAFTSPDNISS
ncbi:MAG TPA: GNAT family N-acetyltransferase, partial [Saprospiraceae bacterium]|nr:GNAT family N-acetyltransferase [Saprospiraceae bacterium]